MASILPTVAFAQQVTTADSRGIAAYKKLSLAELMDVEVTSVSRRAEKLSDTASAIQVISGEEINESGASRLPKALRLFSNLQAAQVDGRQWAITARGFNGTIANKMLVLMDGRTLYTPLFAGVFWDVQDAFMPDLDRIEVISGPGATQWGSNAVNGVINITSKLARETQGGLAFGGAGTERPGFGGFRYGAKLAPNVFYRVYGQNKQQSGSVFPNGADANDGWRQSQGGFRVDWEPQTTDRLTLQGDLYGGRIGQLDQRPIRVGGGNVLGRWTRQSADSNLSLQAYFDGTDRRVPGPAGFGEKQHTYAVELHQQRQFGRAHDVVWGVDYRHVKDDFSDGPTVAFLPARARMEWVGGFLQETYTLPGDAWRLTAGAKVEHNPYTGFEIQPSVRVAWRVAPETLLWGALSRAVRTPSRVDRELYSPSAPPYFLAGGPNFESEKLVAYELGIRSRPTTSVSLSSSAFFQDYDDLRSLEPTATPGTFVIANGVRGKSYGVELNADFELRSNWRLRLGLNELRVQARLKPESRDQESARTQTVHPNRQLKVTSHLDLTSKVYLNTTVRYVAGLGEQGLPAYWEADAKLNWRVQDQWELALRGDNLLHDRHPEFNPIATRREIERNVSVLATWRF